MLQGFSFPFPIVFSSEIRIIKKEMSGKAEREPDAENGEKIFGARCGGYH